jgi:inorganic triphosphatase YgiF
VTSSPSEYLETEQKYDADANFVLPDLGGVGGSVKAAYPRHYYLSATYFDTDDLDLIKNKITLRRRTGGTDEGWHLKRPVRKDTRQELRVPLGEGPASDAGTVPALLAAQVEDITGGQRLRPIAILDTERTVVPLSGLAGEALAEVADDRVTATRLGEPGDKPLVWREIEVELVGDGPALPDPQRLLEAVGQRLQEAGARRSSSASKLGRLLGTG